MIKKVENAQLAANLVIAVEMKIILLGMEIVQLGQFKLLLKKDIGVFKVKEIVNEEISTSETDMIAIIHVAGLNN